MQGVKEVERKQSHHKRALFQRVVRGTVVMGDVRDCGSFTE